MTVQRWRERKGWSFGIIGWDKVVKSERFEQDYFICFCGTGQQNIAFHYQIIITVAVK